MTQRKDRKMTEFATPTFPALSGKPWLLKSIHNGYFYFLRVMRPQFACFSPGSIPWERPKPHHRSMVCKWWHFGHALLSGAATSCGIWRSPSFRPLAGSPPRGDTLHLLPSENKTQTFPCLPSSHLTFSTTSAGVPTNKRRSMMKIGVSVSPRGSRKKQKQPVVLWWVIASQAT